MHLWYNVWLLQVHIYGRNRLFQVFISQNPSPGSLEYILFSSSQIQIFNQNLTEPRIDITQHQIIEKIKSCYPQAYLPGHCKWNESAWFIQWKRKERWITDRYYRRNGYGLVEKRIWCNISSAWLKKWKYDDSSGRTMKDGCSPNKDKDDSLWNWKWT